MSFDAEESNRQRAIKSVRTAMIEKKMTQADLADAADCHEKTIQNFIAGRSVRDQTLFDVCMVLDLDFDQIKSEWSGVHKEDATQRDKPGQPDVHSQVAPLYMGGYTQHAVDHLIGNYLTLRPAFTKKGVIFAYRTEILWDHKWPSLLFQEHQRPDEPYAHQGRVHVPPSSQFIHLVSLTKGAMRMVLLSQLDQTHTMRGIITTLSRNRAMISPVSAPIVYQQLMGRDTAVFGEITANDAAFEWYREQIELCVKDGHATLIS